MKTSKRHYATEEEKMEVCRTIHKLRLSYLFNCTTLGGWGTKPTGKSGWRRFVFTNGMTGEKMMEFFPILN